MAPDKPHPLGLSSEDGKAVARFMTEQREAAKRKNAPKSNVPEDVKSIVAKIVEEGQQGTIKTPAKPGKKSRLGFLRRG